MCVLFSALCRQQQLKDPGLSVLKILASHQRKILGIMYHVTIRFEQQE
jgi:hypothetical protein